MSVDQDVALPLTRTEQAARETPKPGSSRLRRWWRRRPVRRSLVVIHRWPSLILGLFLVIECSIGSVLLFHGDYFRATHSSLYRHTASATPLSPDQAVAAVKKADPDFPASWAASDKGAWIVGDANYADVYGVDPGTGKVTGPVDSNGGTMGFLANLHDCALSCDGYPATLSALGKPMLNDGSWMWRHVSPLREITWGGMILGVLGVLLILLTITGVITWWPGRKRISHGFRVRTGKGRFARDYDLHNVVGVVAVPFLLMWGVTGAAFEFPVVEKAWLAITAGNPNPAEGQYFIEPNKATHSAPRISTKEAVDTALSRVPGKAVWISLPTRGADYYEIDVQTSYGSYAHRAIYHGDSYIYIDAHDASHLVVNDNGTGPRANRFYDKFFEPAHFGWQVNGWWRLVWFVFGLTPLALMVTGMSTWLYRRSTKKRRKQRRRDADVAAGRVIGPMPHGAQGAQA